MARMNMHVFIKITQILAVVRTCPMPWSRFVVCVCLYFWEKQNWNSNPKRINSQCKCTKVSACNEGSKTLPENVRLINGFVYDFKKWCIIQFASDISCDPIGSERLGSDQSQILPVLDLTKNISQMYTTYDSLDTVYIWIPTEQKHWYGRHKQTQTLT